MDKRIIKHVQDKLLENFIVYSAENDLKPSAENMLKYLIQHNIVRDQELKRYFVLDLVDSDLKAGNRNKTKIVTLISDEFKGLSSSTCWTIIKDHSDRYFYRDDIHLI